MAMASIAFSMFTRPGISWLNMLKSLKSPIFGIILVGETHRKIYQSGHSGDLMVSSSSFPASLKARLAPQRPQLVTWGSHCHSHLMFFCGKKRTKNAALIGKMVK